MDVNITNVDINEYQTSGSTAYLRFYCNEDFVDSAGRHHPSASIDSADFYKEVTLTVNTTTKRATVASFAFITTTDAITNQQASWTVTLHDANRRRIAVLADNLPIPESLVVAGAIQWSQLMLHAEGQTPLRDTTVYTRTETENLLTTASRPPATTLTAGLVKISTTAADPLDPIALGSNQLATTTVQGIAKLSTPALSASNPIVVGDNDSRFPHVINVKGYPYYAKGDGTTDDTAALQAALNVIGTTSTGGVKIVLPQGSYKTTAPLTVLNQAGFLLEGAGKYATKISPTSALGSNPVFKFSNCRDSAIRDMHIVPASGTPTAAFESKVETPRNLAAFFLEFSNLIIENVQDGIKFSCTDLPMDQNNEQHLVKNCEMRNCTRSGIRIEHGNSLVHKFEGLYIWGSPYGISALAGSYYLTNSTFTTISDYVFDFPGTGGFGAYYHPTRIGPNVHLEACLYYIRAGNAANGPDLFLDGFYTQGGTTDYTVDIRSASTVNITNSYFVISAGGNIFRMDNVNSKLIMVDNPYVDFYTYDVRGQFHGMNNHFPYQPPVGTNPTYYYRIITAGTTTATGLDSGFIVDASGGNVTINLPAVTDSPMYDGKRFSFKRHDTSTNTVTISAPGNGIENGSYILPPGKRSWVELAIIRRGSNPAYFVVGQSGLSEHIYKQQNLDFPSIPANSTAEMTMTVTGAVLGDNVIVTPLGAPEAGLIWGGYVSTTNTVVVRLANVTTSAIDPANRSFNVNLVRY